VTMMPITICEVQYRMASCALFPRALVVGAEGKIAVAMQEQATWGREPRSQY
jgi:hypothetical protein